MDYFQNEFLGRLKVVLYKVAAFLFVSQVFCSRNYDFFRGVNKNSDSRVSDSKKSPLKVAEHNPANPGYPVSSHSNPFDSDDELDDEKTLKTSKRASSDPNLSTANVITNPFDDVEIKGNTHASSHLLSSAARNKYKNYFHDSGGVENQSVQDLENYAVYKAEKTAKAVNGCLKISEEIREDATKTLVNLHQQGDQITRKPYAAANIDHDLSLVASTDAFRKRPRQRTPSGMISGAGVSGADTSVIGPSRPSPSPEVVFGDWAVPPAACLMYYGSDGLVEQRPLVHVPTEFRPPNATHVPRRSLELASQLVMNQLTFMLDYSKNMEAQLERLRLDHDAERKTFSEQKAHLNATIKDLRNRLYQYEGDDDDDDDDDDDATKDDRGSLSYFGST